MNQKTIKIELYDNYDSNKTATVIAKVRVNASPWITARQLRSAERRAMMMGGSYLRASGELLDAGYDSIDVYDDDGRHLVAEVVA